MGVSSDVTRWLAANAVPLDSLDAGHPAADLAPLRPVLDGVRIVGLGESTHGTAEFFRLKHRLLEFLVRELGFGALAMEASAASAEAVDAYVRYGTGDPVAALDRLGFWTWKTYEVLALVEWLREHNRALPEARRVRFVGIDPQRSADSAGELHAFLRQVAPERAAAVHATLRAIGDSTPAGDPEGAGELLDSARQLLAELEEARAAHTATAGAAATDRAIAHARNLVRAADLAGRSPLGTDGAVEEGSLAARDRYMAEAVAELHETTGLRTAVWAHNSHVMTGRYAAGVPAMGRHLRERYGDDYYALGLLLGKGAFRARTGSTRARPPRRHGIGGGGPKSVEGQLAAAHRGDHLLDLRAARGEPAVERWLAERHFLRSFGAGVPRFSYRFELAPTVLAEEYDGLAYVRRSTCSRPLPLPPEPGSR
ncbi:erythromycin esterase family protein [Kitasatospora sp. NPDC101157]|uniref:erythromycin esterase family protein n=1 Tax=Kitasatospora sp. NPDC101157 TaxID=3364098 RepID=UPI0037F20708